MKKKILLLLILISILMYAGCGGGKSKPTTGTIQGTVSFSSDIASSGSLQVSNSNYNLATNYPIVPLRKNQFTQQSVANEKIVKLRPGLSATESANIIAELGGTIKKKLYGTESTYLIAINDQTFSKSSAIQNSNIEYIEDNLMFQAFAIPNDPGYPIWNYDTIDLPYAWDEQKGNSNVIVAVVDTGVSLSHPDLKANLVPGYDFVDDDFDPSDTGYVENIWASHGTHVAGTISAVTDNSIGIAGVAWNVKIMPIRVLGPNGNGNSVNLIEGINWAVSHGANIINLSLGATGPKPGGPGTETFMEAIDNAIAKGVTVVAAAGNNGIETVSFPANYPPVIAVSAIDHTGAKASYSNYGPEIDLCAPGGKGESIDSPTTQMILSTTYDKLDKKDDYGFMSGTSMAAPHVSGVAALLYSRGLTNPIDIEAKLKSTAVNLEKPLYYGAGIVNAGAALNGTEYGLAAAKVFYYNVDTGTESVFYDAQINGNYTIHNVKPGKYIVYAFIDKDKSEDINNGDLSGISDTITVTAGNSTTANLVLEEYTGASLVTVKEYFQNLLSIKI